MRLQATPGNIVLKMMPRVNKKGEIFLSDGAAEQGDWCTVVSVGHTDGSSMFRVGDTVLRPDPAEYEWVNEETDEVFLIVPEMSIAAWRVDA